MVMTKSTMLELGTPLPKFSLIDVVSGKKYSSESIKSNRAVLVMFICRHCPFVQHVKDELTRLGYDYENKSIQIVAISSNDSHEYPDDSSQSLKEFAAEQGFVFPLCFDETQDVAKAFTAACTPDFFLFDTNKKLVYRGRLDESRPGSDIQVSGNELKAAIDAVLSGNKVSTHQKPSVGCNIKWKVGNEPQYF